MTLLECGIIFGGIPAGAISRKGGLICGIPANIMDMPQANELLNPTLDALSALGGSGSIQEIAETVIQQMQLPDDITQPPHKGGPQTELEYRLSWSRTRLKNRGMIVNSQRGVWALTAEGSSPQPADPTAPGPDTSVGMYPEDELDWRETLLDILQKMDPSSFERLCQRLLRESGFIEVQVTGRSGDGGIDGNGIIRIAGLISFPVVFQCKRWQNSVGPATVRELRGAMAGRADKGLLITTGSFTREAKREATREGVQPIDLIDAELLADKLKELELGIVTKQVELVTVEPDFFANL